jgi:hypothetical protein
VAQRANRLRQSSASDATGNVAAEQCIRRFSPRENMARTLSLWVRFTFLQTEPLRMSRRCHPPAIVAVLAPWHTLFQQANDRPC